MGFQEDCKQWRTWAESQGGWNQPQRAAGADAAAITGLLGATDNDDLIGAAQKAAQCFAVPDNSKPRVNAWLASDLPIQEPYDTCIRLFEGGWLPVPLHNLNLWKGDSAEAVWATSLAERWIWGKAVPKKSAGQKAVMEATKWMGLGVSIAADAIESAAEKKKLASVSSEWHLDGRFQYILTNNRVLRLVDSSRWVSIEFGSIQEVQAAKSDGGDWTVRLKLADNTWNEYRMPNAALHNAVLYRAKRLAAATKSAPQDGTH